VDSAQHLVQPTLQTEGKQRTPPNKKVQIVQSEIKRKNNPTLFTGINCILIYCISTAPGVLMWPLSLIRAKTAFYLNKRATSFPTALLLTKAEYKPEREKPQQSLLHKKLFY